MKLIAGCFLSLIMAACGDADSPGGEPDRRATGTSGGSGLASGGSGGLAGSGAGGIGVGGSGGPAGAGGSSGVGGFGATGGSGGARIDAGSAGIADSGVDVPADRSAGTDGSGTADGGADPKLDARDSGEICSGKPGAKRGKSNQTVTAAGVARTFVYYAPQNLDANRPVPVVIVPHGFSMTADAMYNITQFSALADREGFVAIFPNGEPGSLGPWNVGAGVCGAGLFVGGLGDDQAFVDAMLDFTAADQCVDRSHVFMTGFSMGGYFSNETGCLSTKVRGIGPHSGGTHDLSMCPGGHKAAILFHFTTDALISYDCGTGARDQWVKHNGCNANAPDIVQVKGGECAYYKDCPADGQVALCSFVTPPNHATDLSPGHAWSGGAPGTAFSISETESAAELGWKFFKQYAW